MHSLQLEGVDTIALHARTQLVDDGYAGAAADALGTGTNHIEESVGGADTTSGLNLNTGVGVLAHESDALDGCAASGESGGGLHESGQDHACDLAQLELLILGEQAILEDDLGGDAGLTADSDDLLHLILDVGPVAGLDLGEVDHVIDLVRAVGQCVLGLEDLGGDGGLAEGEADGGAGVDVGAGEELGAELGLDGIDGDHLEVVVLCLLAELLHVLARGVGVEVGVINQAGEVIERVTCHNGSLHWGWCVPAS